jgi:general stress protein 26
MAMPDPTDVDRLLAAARETMAKVKDCWLATTAGDGSINARVVQPIPGVPGEDNWTIWFATKGSSRKAAEIRRDARLTLGYQHHPDRAYVSLQGRAVLVEDRSTIRDLWREEFRPYFPKGPEHPETAFVRIDVNHIELCVNGVTPEPFGSRYSTIERDGNRRWKIVSG